MKRYVKNILLAVAVISVVPFVHVSNFWLDVQFHNQVV